MARGDIWRDHLYPPHARKNAQGMPRRDPPSVIQCTGIATMRISTIISPTAATIDWTTEMAFVASS